MENKTPRDLREIMRDEMVMSDKIAGVLADGPKTIPEIADSLGCPSYEVQLWVMAMRRYGKIDALPKGRADDYFQYGLKAKA
ncbi:MAG: MarR family transcriptional regulator [Acidobacteriota bacterium]|jgi:hypothetical protein